MHKAWGGKAARAPRRPFCRAGEGRVCLAAAGNMRELASEAGPKGGLKSFVSEWCSVLSLSWQTPVQPTQRTAVVTLIGKLDRCW